MMAPGENIHSIWELGSRQITAQLCILSTVQAEQTPKRVTMVAVLAIGAAAAAALLPWIHYGIPSGHDFEFHLNSWIEVRDHWQQGVIYPHWAAWAHYGYGEARFLFYPPISWTIGGILGAILPWKMVPAAFVWLALMLAGLSMLVLARNWLSPSSALFAAVLYTLNPYHLLIIYWRSAFAELLTAAYLPLLVLCLLHLEEYGKRIIAPLALLLAAGWLTNIPGAIMMHYSLGILVVWLAIYRRRGRVLGYAGIAVFAAAALAAVYLLPVLHQKAWVSLDQVLSPGVRPQENFLFAHTQDADHDKFNHLVSMIAAWEFALFAFVQVLWRGKQAAKLWWPVLVLGVSCALLMLPFTTLLWRYLPLLRYVQFPWRWLVVLNLVLSLAIAAAVRSWWRRILIFGLALAPVAIGAHWMLMPWWDTAADVRELVDNHSDQVGDEGVDEYAPAGTDPYDVDHNVPLARLDGAGPAKVTIQRWDDEHRVIAATSGSGGKLVLRLFNYPLWRVSVSGRPTTPETGPHGEMLVPLIAGDSQIEIVFREGWDRLAGAIISLASLAALGLWHSRCKPRHAFHESSRP